MTGTAKPAILLVDDVPQNIMAMKKILENTEAEIVDAMDGQEALNLLKKQEFALILLDVRMPGMSGYELARLIRNIDHAKSTPIIFITANMDSKIRELDGYEAGAVDYISKTTDKGIVTSKIKVFLDLYNQKMELKNMRLLSEEANKIFLQMNQSKASERSSN